MNNKYLDFTGLSTYDQKIKEYIGAHGTPVDKTLTQEDEAADAKVTGEAVTNLSRATEMVDFATVTSGIDTTTQGFTIQTELDKLKVYGTASATRRVCFLNGQNNVKTSTGVFGKTLDAGTYLIESDMTGYQTLYTIEATYTTFADAFDVVKTSSKTVQITFTAPVMIGFVVMSKRDYGTSQSPSYLSFSAKKISAVDIPARDENAHLESEIATVQNKFDNYPTLLSTIPSKIIAGTDYDTITAIGNYKCTSNADAAAMINCPTGASHRLFVLEVISNRFIQIIYCSAPSVPIYYRHYDGASWSNWHKIAYSENIDNAVDPINSMLLSERQFRLMNRYNTNYTISGINKWVKSSQSLGSSNISKVDAGTVKIKVTAQSNRNAIIAFLRSYSSASVVNGESPEFSEHYDSRIVINAGKTQEFTMYEGDTNFVFVTLATSTEGIDITPAEISIYTVNETIPDTSSSARSIQASLRNIAIPCEAIAATLPVQNGEIGVTEYYNKGDVIDGILYSSVYRDGYDVFWNKNLETYYSAMNNPASILYTENYTDRGISNAHAIMGAVCSTFVSYILNMPHHERTGVLANRLTPKEMDSLYEIAVGDILLRDGHIALISQVYTDINGLVKSVDVSEEATPYSRTANVLMKHLPNYLTKNGYTIMENTFGKPRFLKYDGYSEDIIFERGNNTYIEASETSEMWFYIPDAPANVYYKKDDDESFTAYALSGANTKTVNDVTVYDLSACFDGVGDYVLTTDETNAKKCFIKVIDTGTITISNGAVTLSGADNCTPKHYQMVPLNLNDGTHTSVAGNPPEGYYCSWTGYYDFTGEYPQALEDIPSNGKYKIAVEYETGVGLKRVFSDNIGV